MAISLSAQVMPAALLKALNVYQPWLSQPLLNNARELLSKGLVAVLHQSLSSGNEGSRRLTLQSLLFTGDDGPGIREKVHAGKITMLDHDIAHQSSRSLWNDQ